jgi:anti-anti-sigma factor
MEKIKEVTVTGNFDVTNRDRHRQFLTSALAEHPAMLVINMRGITAIDSAGLGVLIATLSQIRIWSGKIVICEPSEIVMMLLRLTNTDKIFTIYRTYADFLNEHQEQISEAATGR